MAPFLFIDKIKTAPENSSGNQAAGCMSIDHPLIVHALPSAAKVYHNIFKASSVLAFGLVSFLTTERGVDIVHAQEVFL